MNSLLNLLSLPFTLTYKLAKFLVGLTMKTVGISIRFVKFMFILGLTIFLWAGIVGGAYVAVKMHHAKKLAQKEPVKTERLPPLKLSDAEPDAAEVYDPAIRMTNEEGKHACSATVLSDKYALTAAHCVLNGMSLYKKPIYIRELTGEDTGIRAEAVGADPSQDVAMIMGDFRKFKKARANFTVQGFIGRMGPFLTCGYPRGDQLVCYPFFPQSSHGFLVAGKGTAYKGMSGGPVIDTSTQEIVGVNSRVFDNGFIGVGPLVGILPALGIELEN